ncbi:MAG: hypothetical protein LR015_08260 [Verrucomicrobia bacterium]|nr:hypothetical protein [Verrucomicrobiota bacterium]
MNLTIQMPDGSQRVLAVDDPDIPLSDCLFQAGIQLKTRCGGRGLCLGCEVTSLGHGVVKSCQVPAKQFAQTTITIPGKSLADNNVHALCAFDVVTPNGIERLKRSGLGLAIDIGTTTLAAGIWDLMSGACLAVASLGNPQRRFGDDVLSRISFAVDKADGGRQLQHCLVAEGLVPLFRNLAAALSAHQPILAACVVGNPTMLHGLTGDSLAGFSRFPFAPVLPMDACCQRGSPNCLGSAKPFFCLPPELLSVPM